MKCRKCGQTASLNMPQHRLALCREHYLEWFRSHTQKTIEKYHLLKADEQVLVAVSGGKDSLALWDVLNRLGYQTAGLYINLGINQPFAYSHQSLDYTRTFAEHNQLTLHVYDVKSEIGQDITQLVARNQRGTDRPCSVCGAIKRHVFNTFTRDHGYEIIATGHNLDDEVAVLLSNNLNWNLEQLSRQSPLLPQKPGFARKIKPFCRFYERETAAYAILSGIEYVEEECPFAVGSKTNYLKTWINQLEKEQPGIKLSYYAHFLQQKKAGFLLEVESLPVDLHPCQQCGEMTAADGKCSFCKLVEPVS